MSCHHESSFSLSLAYCNKCPRLCSSFHCATFGLVFNIIVVVVSCNMFMGNIFFQSSPNSCSLFDREYGVREVLGITLLLLLYSTFFQNSMQWSCNGLAMSLQWSCNDFATVLQRAWYGLATVLLWSCNGPAMVLQWACYGLGSLTFTHKAFEVTTLGRIGNCGMLGLCSNFKSFVRKSQWTN